MAIGYACLTRGVHGAGQRAMRLSSLGDRDRFLEVARANLAALGRILDYNASRGLRLFRVSSSLIPLASHKQNPYDWAAMLAPELDTLRIRVAAQGVRLSMHPGQYTVLDSPQPETVAAAVAEMEYSARLLSCLSDKETLIVLHGGSHADALVHGYSLLSVQAKASLVLENDESRSSPAETLAACLRLGVPMVYDSLHAEVLSVRRGQMPPEADAAAFAPMHREMLAAAAGTWRERSRPQKIHFSLQRPGDSVRDGSHAESIPPRILADRLASWGIDPEVTDILLETKDKNLSAISCSQVLLGTRRADVEREWGAWKYLVMERSRAVYDRIRALLSSAGRTLDRGEILAFYELIAEARALAPESGGTRNALQHVWGYFKKTAEEDERVSTLNAILRFSEGRLSRSAVVARFARLAEKYDEKYLLDSYFFDENC